MKTGFAAFAGEWVPRVEQALDALLPPASEAPRSLHEAMRYALFPGGKRLRPLLVLLGCRATAGDCERALAPAAAIECLHTYSLVHDDLPCMDDDDLRRGRATCHKVFGEALALLAGDALLTLAFAGLARGGAAAVAEVARAAGSLGMVGGQVEDLAAEGADGVAADRSLARVQWIHDRKTGALITASLLAGAHAGAHAGTHAGADAALAGVPAAVLEPLRRYGDLLGRAFQIADDCLDLTGTAAQLGKNPLADVALEKLTWPSVVGLERSLATARALAGEAKAVAPAVTAAAAAWKRLPPRDLDAATVLLQDAASFAVERRS